MIRVRLNASELAIITGHNKYQNVDELREKILIRNRLKKGILIKNDIQKAILSIKNTDILNTIKKELKLSPNTTKKELESHIHKTYIQPMVHKDTEQKSHKELQTLLESLPVTNKLLSTPAYKDLIKQRGTINEPKSLHKSEQRNKVMITNRNDKLYTTQLYQDSACTIILQGKIDGMTNGDTVVESKNRARRLFYKIPNYEKVQLEAYMCLTNTEKSLHIENFNKTTNELYYYHDETFWNKCKEKIIEFTTNMVSSL